jgi:hypothetical protein
MRTKKSNEVNKRADHRPSRSRSNPLAALALIENSLCEEKSIPSQLKWLARRTMASALPLGKGAT